MNNQVGTIEQLQSSQVRNMQSMRHYGNTIPLKYLDDQGQPKYVLGPHFMIFFCTLLISSLFATYLIYSIVSGAKLNNLQVGLALTLALFFYIYSYASVGFSNPGLASTYEQPDQDSKNNQRYCVPCKIVRPLRTIHCYTCDICITGYDHHCPWIGKCVGKQNMGRFKCFVFSVMVLIFSLAISLYLTDQYTAKPAAVKG